MAGLSLLSLHREGAVGTRNVHPSSPSPSWLSDGYASSILLFFLPLPCSSRSLKQGSALFLQSPPCPPPRTSFHLVFHRRYGKCPTHMHSSSDAPHFSPLTPLRKNAKSHAALMPQIWAGRGSPVPSMIGCYLSPRMGGEATILEAMAPLDAREQIGARSLHVDRPLMAHHFLHSQTEIYQRLPSTSNSTET